ncbi:MAG: DNA polymerase II large subunit, partial [Nanoarchaeota archaeon]|nr:DNA polymerase II large subunit [Nanoarchaeota archaeon]
KIDYFDVSFEKAIELSEKYKIPLHSDYIYFWTQISIEQFYGLVDWLGHAELAGGKLVLHWRKTDQERFAKGKRALELLGCEHEVTTENVVLTNKDRNALLFNLGLDVISLFQEKYDSYFDSVGKKIKEFESESVLEIVNHLSSVIIKDKAGAFIGTRMGRPEKAKLRKLTGSPHVLFPVGAEGGRLRSFQSALDVGYIRGTLPNYVCEKCNEERVYPTCEKCKTRCVKLKEDDIDFSAKKIDIRTLYDEARRMTGVSADEVPIVKGVRGLSNKDYSTEHLAKGLLRAKHNLHVNKDGTIRYDMTEMAFTHFKPKEVRTSVEKLKELGYEKDINGKVLENEDQILELFPHDVVLPSCPDTLDERADDVFFNISGFIDDELEKIYGMERMYNAKDKEDIVGALVVCIAPHICTATVGRIIGFSKIQALLASPYMHAAMRRDCDGDEAATMLLMDLLLNFSKKFLPAHRGGTQDSPLVLNTHISAGEVDDQILDFMLGKYPLELYELAEQGKHSSEVKIDSVKQRLADGEDPFSNIAYTHECSDFNAGVTNSSYKILPTMAEKVAAQMDICKKLRAVDTSDVARLIIERHFIRDTRGNLRKFSMQGFRCVGCNEKYRRPPLVGKCTKCGGKIIFTISHGSIIKYMQPALDLARTYEASKYLLESLELTEMYIQSIFGKEKEKQESISNWF